MTEVILAHEIKRDIILTLSSLLVVLFALQSTSEMYAGWENLRFTVRWTAHRCGTIGVLFIVLGNIDSLNFYGIYTFENKIGTWFFMMSVANIYAIVFSTCYSVIMTHSKTARIHVYKHFGRILFAMTVCLYCTVLLIMIVAYSIKIYPPDYVFYLLMGLCGTAVWCLFIYHGWKLRAILKANLKNPQLTKAAKKGFERVSRALFAVGTLLGFGNILFFFFALSTWNNYKPANPQEFQWSSAVVPAIILAGYTVVLWMSWIPIKFKRNGGPHHLPWVFLRFVNSAVDESDGPASGDKRKNSNQPPTPSQGSRDAATTDTAATHTRSKSLQISVDRLADGRTSNASTPNSETMSPETRSLVDGGVSPGLLMSPSLGGLGSPSVRTIMEDEQESQFSTPGKQTRELASRIGAAPDSGILHAVVEVVALGADSQSPEFIALSSATSSDTSEPICAEGIAASVGTSASDAPHTADRRPSAAEESAGPVRFVVSTEDEEAHSFVEPVARDSPSHSTVTMHSGKTPRTGSGFWANSNR